MTKPYCNNVQVVTKTYLDKLRLWHNTICDKALIANNIILEQQQQQKTQNMTKKFVWRLKLWPTQNVEKKTQTVTKQNLNFVLVKITPQLQLKKIKVWWSKMLFLHISNLSNIRLTQVCHLTICELGILFSCE